MKKSIDQKVYSVFGNPQNLVFGKSQQYPAHFSVDCYDRKGLKKNTYHFNIIDDNSLFDTDKSHHKKEDYRAMFFEDERFKADFKKAKAYIDKGRFDKAVVYNTLVLTLEDSLQIKKCLSRITQANRTHFVYGQWTENKGFLGLSPEILFQKSENGKDTFKTISLAGTAPKKELSTILENFKLKEEHGLVTKHFKELFHKKNLPFKISETQIEPYHDLLHLKQNIHFHYEGDQENLISDLAPTPAIGMYPSQYLEKYWDMFKFNLEQDHDLYGGIFHFHNFKQSDAVVMIRNIQWVDNLLHINAGCGVIQDLSLIHI